MFLMYFNIGQDIYVCIYIYTHKYPFFLKRSVKSPFKSSCGDLNSRLWPLSWTKDIQIRILMFHGSFQKG